MAATIKKLRDYERDMAAVLTPNVIARRLKKLYGGRILTAVLQMAKAGIGPDDAPYPPYSASYQKSLGMAGSRTRSGAKKNFLVRSGDMLDRGNFDWTATNTGLTLVWTQPNAKVGIYAEVHNDGLPIGRGGPTKRREFMHFEARASREAVNIGIARAWDDLIKQFNAGRRIVTHAGGSTR